MTKARRFIQTGRVDESGTWYGLDNAGVIMPSVSDDVNSSYFRMEVILERPIDRAVLASALSAAVRRFPYFNVTLRKGIFWHYFEECPDPPEIEDDEASPCQGWNINSRGTRLVRIKARGARLACELSHALTDGTGAASFLKTLLALYLMGTGVDPGAELGSGEYADIHIKQETPAPEEYEDGYQLHFPGNLPAPEPNPRAWHLESPLLDGGEYRVITGEIDLQGMLALAKSRQVSLTELLGAVYLDSLQELWFSRRRRRASGYISLEIPVNLRHFFPTNTKRNFSLFVILRENLKLGRRDFEELVRRAHHRMRLETDPKSISREIARNAGGTRNIAVRLVPLFIKTLFARALFAKFGEVLLSGFISNLGSFRLPPGFEPHVRAVHFIPAPSRTLKTNASSLSWKNRLYISFGSLASSRELETVFFRKLKRLGQEVLVREWKEENP